MTASIRDARESPPDRQWIERAYRDYLEDLSAGKTGVFPALTVTGQGTDELILPWFRDDRATPFVILNDGRPAGFALVERMAGAGPARVQRFRLTEFFIQRPHRRRGLGRATAQLLFDRFPGEWTVAEPARHAGSVAFWRKVIAGYTAGRYRERLANGEVVHSFTTTVRTPEG